jgi:secretion/DNA translocation related TadE-like protein
VTATPTGEGGTAAVLSVVFAGVLVVVTFVLGGVGGVLVGQRRVESAADMAALAGAVAVQHQRDGCAAARDNATRNHVELQRCSVDDALVSLVVGRTVHLLGRDLRLRSDARAGPEGPP